MSHQYVSRSHPDRGVGLERRKLVASSLRILLLLAGTGSDRLSSSQVDLLALLLRPQLVSVCAVATMGDSSLWLHVASHTCARARAGTRIGGGENGGKTGASGGRPTCSASPLSLLHAEALTWVHALLLVQEAAARLRARGKRAGSIAECLGLWDSQHKAVLPLATVLAAVSAALPLVGTQIAQLPFSIDVLPVGRLFIDLDPPPTAPRALPPPVEPTPAMDSGTHATAPAAGSGSLGCGEDRPLSIQVHMPSDEDDPAAPYSPTGGRPSGASGWVEWDDRCVVNEGEAVTARLLGARRRTLVFRGSRADATRTAVQIVDCHGCHIYVLAPVRSLEVVGCTNCTVMVGAVGRVASIRHCERLTLLTNAAALHAHSLNESSLQLSSATRPLLWGENHRLTLAPFGAVYASLPRHLSAAGLSPELRHNRWAEPICCLPSLTTGTAPGASGCFCLLAPRSYLPFHIPFDVPAGETAGGRIAPVVQLPDEYAEALACHAKQLLHFSEELGELMGSDGVKSEVGAALQARFREWLVRTGNMRQVVELLAAAPAASAG